MIPTVATTKVLQRCATIACTTFVLAACRLITTSDCLAIATPGLDLTAVDALTLQSILPGLTVIIVHNGLRDSTVISSSFGYRSAGFAFGQDGVFSVTVRRSGYAESTKDNIVVGSDRCRHPNAVAVAFSLSPVP